MNLYFLELMDWFDWLIVILIFVGMVCLFCLNRENKWWKWAMGVLAAAVVAFGIIILPKQLKLNKEVDNLIEEERVEMTQTDSLYQSDNEIL